jgi:hypothetical protein
VAGGLLRGDSDVEETDEGTLRGNGKDGRIQPSEVEDSVGLDKLVYRGVKRREIRGGWIRRGEVEGRWWVRIGRASFRAADVPDPDASIGSTEFC